MNKKKKIKVKEPDLNSKICESCHYYFSGTECKDCEHSTERTYESKIISKGNFGKNRNDQKQKK